MPNEDFWIAVDRLVAADDAGVDVGALADRLLDADPSLGPQLREAMTSLDTSALAEAVKRSDGRGVSEDAMIAVACAVVEAGPAVFAESVRDPGSLVRPWDLSRGDLLLVLDPGVALGRESTTVPKREPYTIDVAIGDSRFGWPGWMTDAVAHHQCRRHEKDQRWRAIFDRHDAEHLVIGLEAARGVPNRVGRCSSPRAGFLVVSVTWDTPRSPFGLPGFFRSVLDAVATSLERPDARSRCRAPRSTPERRASGPPSSRRP